MRRFLQLAFLAILAAMLWVTWTASIDRDVLTAGRELWADPWGKATLFDAYFAFLTSGFSSPGANEPGSRGFSGCSPSSSSATSPSPPTS